ncbi:hypothetical protein M011DRAFT_280515 [Sporormia fimetaria CBS 119925]|uniref:Uncharacterized protein n=1 Tax=Sporormia fimetaria CBS 119925 TaxID=1340428 RepID=A0A6A6VKY8_9PLEO|nr:hypothetical protein M011DRAFT_280515 [Sporormia fimetaria CBS 119925]
MSKNEEKEQQQHLPNPAQDESKDNGEEEQQGTGGLLSGIGDPLALGKGLRPIGKPVEKVVSEPLGKGLGGTTRGALGPLVGQQHERSEVLGGDNKDSYEHRPEKIAGKEQTGDNPLGLDNTGRWGFRDE